MNRILWRRRADAQKPGACKHQIPTRGERAGAVELDLPVRTRRRPGRAGPDIGPRHTVAAFESGCRGVVADGADGVVVASYGDGRRTRQRGEITGVIICLGVRGKGREKREDGEKEEQGA